jgi:hypothetical protein
MKRRILLTILALSCIATLENTRGEHVLQPPTMPNPNIGLHLPWRVYHTLFPKAQNPISENESWINGGTVGFDWADVRTKPGIAFGTDLATQYADPTAVLAGTWGSNQEVERKVTVRKAFSDCCHEVELRLRTTIRPHAITGYEVLCSVVVGNPYLEIVRWNGPLNDFTYIGRTKLGCGEGDTLKAIAFGNRISPYTEMETRCWKARTIILATVVQGLAFTIPRGQLDEARLRYLAVLWFCKFFCNGPGAHRAMSFTILSK